MRIIYYLLSLVLAFYFAAVYKTYIPKIFLAAIIIFPFVMYAFATYLKRHIVVELETKSLIIKKNQPFRIQIHIQNKGFIPTSKVRVCLEFKSAFDSKPGKVMLDGIVDGNDMITLEYTATSTYCGRLEVSILSVLIFDYFNFIAARMKKKEPIILSILPMVYTMPISISHQARAFVADSEEYDPHKKGDDVSEVFGVRSYQPGDRLQKVHWKLSARKDKWMIKEFSHPLGCNIVLLVDLYHPLNSEYNLMRMDAFVEMVAATSAALIEENIHHYIAWYCGKTEMLQRKKIERMENLQVLIVEIFSDPVYETQIPLESLYHQYYPAENYYAMLHLETKLSIRVTTNETYQLNEERIEHSIRNTSFVL